MRFDNYACEGQMDIFSFIQKPEASHIFLAGEWITEHGNRVKFIDIQVNNYYVADYSTKSQKCYKVVYVKWIKEDSVGYVDSEKGIKGEWRWGNNYSALTRERYIDSKAKLACGEADTNGWWYELPKVDAKYNSGGIR